MKNIKKYISVVVIAIAMTITFFAIKSNKTNKSVKMQNKEALAKKIPTILVGKACIIINYDWCYWIVPEGMIIQNGEFMK